MVLWEGLCCCLTGVSFASSPTGDSRPLELVGGGVLVPLVEGGGGVLVSIVRGGGVPVPLVGGGGVLVPLVGGGGVLVRTVLEAAS